ncbi:MAG: Galactose mutarotase related enzyme [Acidobacteriaceae bacterium]|nr:Galactose mutarotase related enzyme [Acidobacteriaceae bacterium]
MSVSAPGFSRKHVSPAILLAATLLLAGGCKSTAPAPETTNPQAVAVKTQINGEDVVTLERKPAAGGKQPEFTSATVIPGRGMNLFQITADIPGRGKTDVFFAPSLDEAKSKLNGSDADKFGNASFSFGGAFLVPYPNRIRGKLSDDKQSITTTWQGKKLTLPANFSGKKPGAELHSIHGLINDVKVEDVKVTATPDGQTVTGIIHAGDFGGRWPSKTDLTFSIELSGKDVTTTITAKNVGDVPEPMSIGWHPYFAIPSGDRTQVRLHIPAAQLAVVNNYDDVFPTGKLKPVKGTKYDYTAPGGKPLGGDFLDDNFSKLNRTDGGVDVQLIDPKANYGIHVIGESPEIKTVQVYAPTDPGKNFAAVEEQFNFADPFGKEWHGTDTGMVTLKPGAEVTWKVKLELFTPASK